MKKILILVLGVIFAANAQAVLFTEIGDATDVPGGQAVGAGTTSIAGFLAVGDTADVFGFTWSGGVLTMDSLGSSFDTQLHLFDGLGVGIAENDDKASGCCLSEISLNLAAGNYLIGMSSFNDDALDSAFASIFGFTNTFNDLNGNLIQGPQGATGVLAGWDGTSSGADNNYFINFSDAVSVDPAAVFEPASLSLLGIGLLGLGIRRRRSL